MRSGDDIEWRPRSQHATIEVDEEFLLLDPRTGVRTPRAEDLVEVCGPSATVAEDPDVVGTTTAPCRSSDELRTRLHERRRSLADAAAVAMCSIVGAGSQPGEPDAARPTSSPAGIPFPVWRENSTCGMHVHVGIRDPHTAVAVSDALRPMIPVLLALAANSPMRVGQPAGLASLRGLLVEMRPQTGIPPRFGSWQTFQDVVRSFQRRGIGNPWAWWHVRPNPTRGTIELRMFDAQSDAENAHALALFARAICLALVDSSEHRALPPSITDELALHERLWSATSRGPSGSSLEPEALNRTLRDDALDLIDWVSADLPVDVAKRLRSLAHAPEFVAQLDDFRAGGTQGVVRGLVERTAGRRVTTRAITPLAVAQ